MTRNYSLRFLFCASIFFPFAFIFPQEQKPKTTEQRTPISIPDVEGVSIIKENEKDKEKEVLSTLDEDEDSGIERHRFFNVRYLPLAEGFANRPKDLENERLLILGRVQLRGLSGQTESAFNNGNSDYNAMDWNFRRVRLGFMYEGGSWWGMQMHLRVEDGINRPYITTQTDPVTGNVERVNLRDN